MKKLSLLVLLLCYTFNATAQVTKQAANGCQPRLYTQLDFFKISSGALKNNSSSSKSIICSIDTEFDVRFFDPGFIPLGITAWISYQTNGEKMQCTLYMRENATGALVDSETLELRRGKRKLERIGFVRSSPIRHDEVYTYIQCSLPAGARIFSITVGTSTA